MGSIQKEVVKKKVYKHQFTLITLHSSARDLSVEMGPPNKLQKYSQVAFVHLWSRMLDQMTYCGPFQHYPFYNSMILWFCYSVISVHGTCSSNRKLINRIWQHSDTQFLLHYTLLFASLGWLSAADICHAESTRQMPSVHLRSSLSKIVYKISQTAVASNVSISWEPSGQAGLGSAMETEEKWHSTVIHTNRAFYSLKGLFHQYNFFLGTLSHFLWSSRIAWCAESSA